MNIYSELIAEKGFLSFSVQGNSMEPFLKDGDFVRIYSIKSIIPGNCYIFKYNDKLTLHRLAYKGAGFFCFIGDNSNKFEIVTRENICGVLIGSSHCGWISLLITLTNLFYLLTQKLSVSLIKIYMAKIRRKIIRFLYRSFYEKNISKAGNIY